MNVRWGCYTRLLAQFVCLPNLLFASALLLPSAFSCLWSLVWCGAVGVVLLQPSLLLTLPFLPYLSCYVLLQHLPLSATAFTRIFHHPHLVRCTAGINTCIVASWPLPSHGHRLM